ncbi:Silent information regulator protein Sir2 [Rhodomicrobium vannielii ATCC 17100]|uniref:NAD-dependent protein deacylase n=1 Tax=Rhodomicrobium vannielii (strain ATCC 17100 / DSM 162 / LMG 4299 / NCIMB 10020 / ATH 3.1.1) TaxID=648757 RepID=E3I0M9_RHOVT|nr:NAD-dependent deacylase [Rhodomicrobium vannielii]ADP70039.1 Silent information regulator protein Sir2 [Rhodomicrobium vannielii ATCC 17100]
MPHKSRGQASSISRYNSIVILTGAGLSAESGLHTFRDKDGIWAQYDYREVATPEGYKRNPKLVLQFYNERRRQNAGVQPNAAHLALARLEAEYPGGVLIVTQNIDPLHEMAGSKKLIHMHGEIMKALCAACATRHGIHDDITLKSVCPSCGRTGVLRPDVVWFGELPYEMERIYRAILGCDLFISIGTSGTVYPAAGFVEEALRVGAHTVELNLEPSHGISRFIDAIHGPATEVVPAYVERLLKQARS